MILKFDRLMTQFHEQRTIHMYLPDDYLYSQKRYPVLYMFDGHNLFNDEDATYGKSWNLANQILWNQKELIVVGQECSHHGNDRLYEYSPYPFADEELQAMGEGFGEVTMNFFIHELKPYIDVHFPTLSQRETTWIGGSSCGGAMALYAGMRHNDIFSRSLVLSPYLIPTSEYFLLEADHTNFVGPSSFYISWGALEGSSKHAFVQETKIVTEIANRLLKKGAHIQFNVKPEGAHTESDWEQEAPVFLNYLFQNE